MAIESKMRQPPMASLGHDEPKKGFPFGGALVILFCLAIVMVGGWYFFVRQPGGGILTELQDNQEAVVPARVYQAVFLDNGQVYFGELTDRDDEFYTLTNVYYLQIRQDPQAGEADSEDVSLIKLGNEMHGPEDEMQINKEHILFIEDLKSDSKVSKAIVDYLSKKK